MLRGHLSVSCSLELLKQRSRNLLCNFQRPELWAGRWADDALGEPFSYEAAWTQLAALSPASPARHQRSNDLRPRQEQQQEQQQQRTASARQPRAPAEPKSGTWAPELGPSTACLTAERVSAKAAQSLPGSSPPSATPLACEAEPDSAHGPGKPTSSKRHPAGMVYRDTNTGHNTATASMCIVLGRY